MYLASVIVEKFQLERAIFYHIGELASGGQF